MVGYHLVWGFSPGNKRIIWKLYSSDLDKGDVPSLKLTVRTWNWIVRISVTFPFGSFFRPIFRGSLVVSGSIHGCLIWFPGFLQSSATPSIPDPFLKGSKITPTFGPWPLKPHPSLHHLFQTHFKHPLLTKSGLPTSWLVSTCLKHIHVSEIGGTWNIFETTTYSSQQSTFSTLTRQPLRFFKWRKHTSLAATFACESSAQEQNFSPVGAIWVAKLACLVGS